MKTKKCELYFFAAFLLTCVFHLNGASFTNTTPVFQESWETISNRWCAFPLESVKQIAVKGNVSAQYYVGCTYYHGNGVPVDLSEGFKWRKMAADNGLVRAQKIVGSMYYSGDGVSQDYSAAAKYFLLAAENGNELAQSSIGYLYREGLGVPKDPNESVKWFRKAADQGVAEAQRSLGYAYETGSGVLQDYAEAARLYRLAGDQGDMTAQNNLSELYFNGRGVPKSEAEGLKWINKYLEQRDQEFKNQMRMAEKYRKGDGVPKDLEEAFKWMQMAAQHNQAQYSEVSHAIYELALMYENGEGVQKDLSKSQDLMLQAAAGFWADACFRVGQMYENGEGVPQDDYEAVKNFYNGAYGGRKFKYYATENLLKLYTEGRGLINTNAEPLDYFDRQLTNKTSLIEYFQREDNTTPRVQFYIGKIYYGGKLVPQDLVKADIQLRLAVKNGVLEASNILEAVEAQISPEQKTLAQRQTDILAKKIEEKQKELQRIQQMTGR